MDTIEQIALRIRQEMLDGYDYCVPLGSDKWHEEFGRRLTAALRGEPVAWMAESSHSGEIVERDFYEREEEAQADVIANRENSKR